jgi:hypothetical protein
MIQFIASMPWWGWCILIGWLFCVIFNLQMAHLKNMTPEQREQWMKDQASKKPWYMQ